MKEGKTIRVLLIEDNPVTQDSLAILLRREGHIVQTAGCGREALDAMRGGFHPDVIVLDLQLPGMSSDSFMHKMLEAPAAGLPILAISAGDPPPSLDGTPFLKKPFQLPELLDALNRTVATARAGAWE